MAKISTAAAKLKGIAKTGNMAETFVKGKQTIKAFEERVRAAASERVKAAASESVNIRMHKAAASERVKAAASESVNIRMHKAAASESVNLRMHKAAASESVNIKMHKEEERRRISLKDVVTLCTKRWFQDTLKEARSGDVGMQILVGQMYCNGYGVPQSIQKGKAWFQKATKSRLKYVNLSSKPPGYNASESDSDKKDNKHK